MSDSDALPPLEVEVLGTFRVRRGDRVLALPPSVRGLVALLVVCGPLERSAVAAHLWPELPAERAGADARTVLWRAHRAAPGLLVDEGGALALADGVDVDLHGVTRWCRGALAGTAGAPVPERVGRPLLPGHDAAWVSPPREHLVLLQLRALEAAAQQALAQARPGDAAAAAAIATEVDPLRESAVRLLVQAHLAEGNTGSALRAYRAFAACLREEVGVPPSAALRALLPLREDERPAAARPAPAERARRPSPRAEAVVRRG